MKKMTDDEKHARDAAICARYLAGATLAQCGRPYGMTRQRVKQIVKNAGLWRGPRSDDRDAFLGVNISEADKAALKIEAAREGKSVSLLTSDWIKEKLAARRALEPEPAVGDQ